jgi:hypothetical protein
MNIAGATGLTEAQRSALRALGALEDTDNTPSDSEIQLIAAHG